MVLLEDVELALLDLKEERAAAAAGALQRRRAVICESAYLD